MLVYERDVLPYLSEAGNWPAGTQTIPSNKLAHAFLNADVKHRAGVAETFCEDYPKYLDKNRPKEQLAHKKYRKDVYENTFIGFLSRIKGALDYIHQADDFDVQFGTSDIREDVNLETYTGKDFSAAGDLPAWFFSEAVPTYVDDPNALLLVVPPLPALNETEYTEPRPFVIDSASVWVYRRSKLAVCLLPDENDWLTLCICDQDSYTIARRLPGVTQDGQGKKLANWWVMGLNTEAVTDPTTGTLTPVQTFTPPLHYCSGLPARKLGLKRAKTNRKGEEHYKSLIADSLPHIRLAQGNQSDIQVEVNFHVASQEWRRATGKCKNPVCTAGVIVIRDTEGVVTGVESCPNCKGSGYNISGSGLEIQWVGGYEDKNGINADSAGKLPPGAPGGFIPRNIDALREFVTEFKRNKEEAYSTINMQFVMVTPYEQSGTSKKMDREELYRELNTQAAHLVGLLTFCYECIDAQRYGPAGQSGEQMPEVLIPVRFNLDNAELTREELNNAKDKDYDPTLVEAYEKKMLLYTTGAQSDEYQRYVLRTRLDPYKDMTDEMKAFLLGIQFRNPDSPQQRLQIRRIYFSINFDGLVADALRTDPDFWQKSIEAQHAELIRMNEELVGPQTTGPTATPDSFPTIQPLTLQPPVNVQQADQVLDNRN